MRTGGARVSASKGLLAIWINEFGRPPVNKLVAGTAFLVHDDSAIDAIASSEWVSAEKKAFHFGIRQLLQRNRTCRARAAN